MALVGVIVGSKSDESVMQETLDTLQSLGVAYDFQVVSAHRNPDRTMEYAKSARSRGLEVIIAGAGGSAALPGVVAAWTTLPVIGVPLASSALQGTDALYAISQMPPGIPVACVAIGSWGARNAAFLAAQILGAKYPEIRDAYDTYRESLQKK